MVRFGKFKNWYAAENVLYRDTVPTGGTSGHLGQNRDCPAEIGTLDMSVSVKVTQIGDKGNCQVEM